MLMGNNMSATVFQQIKDKLNTYFPSFGNNRHNHDRKRRASEDFYVLPTKSRKVEEILNEYSEYSDHEMGDFDIEKRKREIRHKRQSAPSTTLLNGFGNTSTSASALPTPSFFLSSQPVTMGAPLYLVDTSGSFGNPLANSSTVRLGSSSRIPALLPLSRKKPPVPDALPISNGGNLFNGLFSKGLSQGRQAASRNPSTSILHKTHLEHGRNEYMALLQRMVPAIYKSPHVSLSIPEIKKTVETQTESDATSENGLTKELVDLTDDKDESKSSRSTKDEDKLSNLMLKLECKSSYTTKADTLRERFEEERRMREQKIRDEELVLEGLRKETEECHKQFRKRILDTPISFEDIIIKLDEPEEEEEEVSYPQLTRTHLECIKRALSGGSGSAVIISKFNMNITRSDLNTLVGMTWLNDEVINFYMNLIIERSSTHPELPKAYCFNTFFIPTVMSRGHAGVKRWTRKVDIFSYDLIPVPVHVGKIHWCMAVIRMKEKIIRYYDSMGNPNQPVLDALEQYLIAEAKDKKQMSLDTSDWVKQNVTDCPHQTNGSDCGVFSCMFAEHLTRNANFTFGQAEMSYFRHKMIYEIATGELLT